ncbi:MAG: cardiolipin synthase B [Chloroflexi bacterium]|nr:cardiolipin synthase B [Chloroflexota bacterium]
MTNEAERQDVVDAGGAPTLAARGHRLNRALTRTTGARLRRGNALTLLHDGFETYDDWLAAIHRAERWIHLDNYIFRADGAGQRFAEALRERSAAGVRVRVLYDWYGSLDVPSGFWRRLRQHGIEVRAVNPPGLDAPLAVVRRDHRKLLAVDGVYGSVGGVGIADAWLERSATGLPYRDTAVRVLGPAVADIERAFAGVWRRNGPPLPRDERPRSNTILPAGEQAVRVIIQEPGRMRIARALQIVTALVENRVWIADAYFLASPILREALISAARDGIDVRLLLPSTNDLPIVGAMSRFGYRALLQSGVRVWEYGGPMMHAKTTVADGWWSRVGSTNLNVTGMLTNWEIDLVAEDRGFGQQMEAMFERDLADAREIRTSRRSPRQHSGVQRARTVSRGGGPQAATTVASVGGVAVQSAAGESLLHGERLVTGALGATAIGASLLAARFPRVVAWPLAAIVGAVGAFGLRDAIRRRKQGPDQSESDDAAIWPA